MALVEERKALEQLSAAWRRIFSQLGSRATLPPPTHLGAPPAAEVPRTPPTPTPTQAPP